MSSGSKWITAVTLCSVLVIAAAAVLLWPIARFVIDSRRQLHSYYIPSTSMSPTLQVGDRFMPRAFGQEDLRRGTVVIAWTGFTHVMRIVGLPGDVVELHNGVVILNGKAVAQRPAGEGPPMQDPLEPQQPSKRFLEQFPGEPTPHAILDLGASPGDAFGPVRVPEGHVFALGDNRDNAADSRFAPHGLGGAGMVPVANLTGVVDFIMWSTGRRRVGRAIDDLEP